MLSKDLKKEIKKINEKEKEFKFWKSEFDKKMLLREKNRSCNI